MKQTYQPNVRKRKKKHGFMQRMRTKSGRRIIANRRRKGRKVLSAQKAGGIIIILESIKKEVDIKRIFKEGIYINKKYFIIYINQKESRSDKIRTRFIVTKKIGTAVVRNRIKRLLREILRLLKIVNFKEVEIIIIAKKNIKNIGFWELDTEIKKVLKQV